MSNQITIGGTAYTVKPLTVAMAGALLRASSVMEMAATGAVNLHAISCEGLENVVAALEAVTGAAPGAFNQLPIDELANAITETTLAFLAVNGPYLTQKVVPACTALAATFKAIQAGLQAPVPDASKPAPPPATPRRGGPRSRKG
jgi:hypothetical protein